MPATPAATPASAPSLDSPAPATAIVVLGSPNGVDGRLSVMAQARVDAAVRLFFATPQAALVLTGGFGPFNLSTQPHAEHLRACALAQQVPPERIHLCAASRNTVEDATHTLRLMARLEAMSGVVVVTSDFHLARARLIFEAVLGDLPVQFHGAVTPLPPNDMAALAQHEERALARLIAQNGVMLALYRKP